MAGLENDTLYGTGLDLSGTPLPANKLATDGFVYIGNSAGNPVAALPISSDGSINWAGGNGSLDGTVAPGLGFDWVEETTTTRALSVNEGVIGNNAGTITMTLPVNASLGDRMCFLQKGAGTIRIAQNAGQTIHTVNGDTTTGVGGRIDTIDQWTSFCILCVTDDTDFAIEQGSHGSLLIT